MIAVAPVIAPLDAVIVHLTVESDAPASTIISPLDVTPVVSTALPLLLIAPKPFTIEPTFQPPTCCKEDIVTPEPKVSAVKTDVPLTLNALLVATDSPEDDSKYPPSDPLTINVTSADALPPSMSSPAFWLDALGDASFMTNNESANEDDAPAVTRFPSTCISQGTTSSKSAGAC